MLLKVFSQLYHSWVGRSTRNRLSTTDGLNTLTRPDPARVYRTCTKRISLESSLKELSFKTITKSMGVSMKELWTEMCVLKKGYQRPLTAGL